MIGLVRLCHVKVFSFVLLSPIVPEVFGVACSVWDHASVADLPRRVRRGNAHEQLGHPKEAQEAWESALSLDPELQWARDGLKRLKASK